MVARTSNGHSPVIVGVSGTAASFAAARQAAEIFGDDREYVLVRAGDPDEDPATIAEELDTAAALNRARCRRQVVLGAAAAALAETAERFGAAAIAIGARADAPTWAQSTVRAVTRAATVPVLVVHYPMDGRRMSPPVQADRSDPQDRIDP